MEHSTNNLTGIFTLLLSAVIWGFAFVAQRASMEFVGPFTFNGIRFALGSLVLVPLVVMHRRSKPEPIQSAPSRHQWIAIGLAGLVLFVSANLQQIGLVYTTAGKAGFITGLYVVFVPLFGLFCRHRVSAYVWAGCGLAAGGMYLLSVVGVFSIAAGDALVLGSALGWAVHVHLVGWLAQRMHPLRVAILQFAICAVLSLGVAGFTETIRIGEILQAGWMIAYAGILSVGVAYTLQVVGQQRVDPARAGIILSLEAVFAVIGGRILLGEILSTRGLIGCALMLGGMMLAQLRAQARSDAADPSPSME
ncbi:DMT family transporter [Candidatus Bipolaricaulota bacterium]|nr:DMT family transporter [Candidatus Bipolaricaulota bacterium]